MPINTSLRKSFSTELANSMLAELQYGRATYYYFIGGVSKWNTVDVMPVEGITDSLAKNKALRSEIVYVKKISPNEVSLVIPKIEWETGTAYDMWDDTLDMTGRSYYVMNSEYNVYKCLDNNRGALQTVSPVGESLGVLRTPDGYLWKFMYNIPVSKRLRFISNNYMPVQKALTDGFYSTGSVSQVLVTAQGSGYSYNELTEVVMSSVTTTGSGATGTLTRGGIGQITQVNITNPGSGYTYGAEVVFSLEGVGAAGTAVVGVVNAIAVTGGGTGYTSPTVTLSAPDHEDGIQATATAVVSSGVITAINVINKGSGYTTAPTVTIADVDGIDATATAAIADGIGSVLLDNNGVGYTVDSTVSFVVGAAVILPTLNSAGTLIGVKLVKPGFGFTAAPVLTLTGVGALGSGKYGNATAILKAFVHQGKIVNITIEDPGKDYPFETATTIEVRGDGEGAVLYPVIYEGKLIDVIVDNPGKNYTSLVARVISSAGSGATVSVFLHEGDLDTSQNIVEQTATKGGLYAAIIETEGSGYNDTAYAVINGDGAGATAELEIFNTAIKRVIITNPGSGYSYATVTIIDPIRQNYVLPDTANAVIRLVASPEGGHGSDAIREFSADRLHFSTTLVKDSQSGVLSQEYRNYGIIKDPKKLFSGLPYKTSFFQNVWKVKFQSLTGLVKDSILNLINLQYRVISFNGEDNTVLLISLNSQTIPPIGTLTLSDNPSVQFQSINLLTQPDFDKYSGNMIMTSNEEAFIFDDVQTVSLNTFIKT